MKNVCRIPLAMLTACICLVGSQLFAQCENGQCQVPRTPVLNFVQQVQETQPVRSVARGVVQTVARPVVAMRAGLFGARTVYRSSSVVTSSCATSRSSMLTVGCGCGCGNCSCSPGSLAVGAYDYDGALITSVGVVGQSVSVAPSVEVSALGIKKRKESRQAVLEAAQQAYNQRLIEERELQAIKIAVKSPRMLSRIEDLILEKAQSSGAYTFALDANGDPIKAKVDWEAIGDFILKIAPLIFKLIEMFALHDPGVSQEILAFHGAAVEPLPVAYIGRDFFIAA